VEFWKPYFLTKLRFPKYDGYGFVCLQERETDIFTNNCGLGFTYEYNVYTNSRVVLSKHWSKFGLAIKQMTGLNIAYQTGSPPS
jgi:hypothetical protein